MFVAKTLLPRNQNEANLQTFKTNKRGMRNCRVSTRSPALTSLLSADNNLALFVRNFSLRTSGAGAVWQIMKCTGCFWPHLLAKSLALMCGDALNQLLNSLVPRSLSQLDCNVDLLFALVK